MEIFLVNSDVNTTPKITITMPLKNVRCWLAYVHVRVRHFSTFLFIHVCPPIVVRFFFLADQRGLVCFPRSVRFEPPNGIKILKFLSDAKKQNVPIYPYQCGLKKVVK